MLSSKKNSLIDCLLQRIIAPTPCLVCSPPVTVPATSTAATWGQQSAPSKRHHLLPTQPPPPPPPRADVDESCKPFTARVVDIIGCCLGGKGGSSSSSNNDNQSFASVSPNTADKCRQLFVDMVRNVLRCLAESELLTLLSLVEKEGCFEGECLYLTKKYGCDYSGATTTYHDHHHTSASPDSTNCCWSRLASRLPPHELLFLSYRWSHRSQTSWSSDDIIYLPWYEHHHHQHHPPPPHPSSTSHLCINPYHYCFLLRSNATKLADFDSVAGAVDSPPLLGSFSDSGVSVDCSVDRNSSTKTKPWAIVAYWELRERMGKFTVDDNLINITTVPQRDKRQIAFLALDSIFANSNNNGGGGGGGGGGRNMMPDLIFKVRQKIGSGITLLRDGDNNVWLYNRSSALVFVSSPTLEAAKILQHVDIRDIGAALNAVTKVMPGDLIKVFDVHIVQKIKSLWQTEIMAKYRSQFRRIDDFNSFCLSFVKGFGRNYSRADILQCPCWLEVIIVDGAGQP